MKTFDVDQNETIHVEFIGSLLFSFKIFYFG